MARTEFPLFHSHLDLAHHYWERLIKKGDHAIDATCGNGHDTLRIAQLALTEHSGKLWGFDIQEEAIVSTRTLLSQSLPEGFLQNVFLTKSSHVVFPKEIVAESIKLIVYNLGYLPGGDKALTTQVSTTLQSLEAAQKLIQHGGVISVTCYPGHTEGASEQEQILNHVSAWAPNEWSCTQHRWLNRRQSPTLLLLQRCLY